MKHIRKIIAITYILVDLIFLTAAFFLPHYLYYGNIGPDFKMHHLIYAFWIVTTILLFSSSQLYHTLRELSIWREAKRTFRAFLLSTLLTILFLFFLKIQTLSRFVIAQNICFGLLTLVAWRVAKRFFVQYLVSRGFNNVNVLIIGAGRAGKKLAAALLNRRELGFRIVGFLDDRVQEGTLIHQYAVLGKVSEFDAVARKNFIDQVFITIPSERNLASDIGLRAKLLGIAMQVVPDDFGLDPEDFRLHTIGDVPLIEYHNPLPNYRMMIMKRLMDIAVSLFTLTLLIPVFIFIGIAIKLDSSGPIFYPSRRWGRKGRLFNCYKFRSMIMNAEELRQSLLNSNEMDGPVFKMKDDPRITRAGRWIRKYSLDELPQLWNVLKGDMSLVGPRPLPEREEVGEYKLEYLHRLSIKPGLTCLWQIRGRNDISFRRWMRLDEYYIRNWTPGMDIGILLKTIPAVIKGRGAY